MFFMVGMDVFVMNYDMVYVEIIMDEDIFFILLLC